MVSNEPETQHFLARAFADDGWQVLQESGLDAAVARLEDRPTLILLTDAGDLAESTTTLRAHGVLASSVPILAVGTAPAHARTGVDAYLEHGLTPVDVIAQAKGWQPDSEITTIGRLVTAFGREEIDALLDRFRAELIATLAAPDWFGMTETAHRLAGIAGTLGFAAVSRDWLAISEGEAVDRCTIYRHLRVAVAIIDHVRSRPAGAG